VTLRMANSHLSGDWRPEKGLGNAPAIDQARHRQKGACQTVPPGYSR
jgi:hypothetical protein